MKREARKKKKIMRNPEKLANVLQCLITVRNRNRKVKNEQMFDDVTQYGA